MKIIIHLLFLIYAGGNIVAQENNDISKLLWIFDRWVSAGEDESRSYEHWEKVSDDLYTGGSETIRNGDTVFTEKLRIEKTNDGIFYVADVKHNPEPVKFKLTLSTENEAVFENPLHDFPQKITYRQEEGKLHAFIEGPGKDGQWKKIDFYMDRMK